MFSRRVKARYNVARDAVRPYLKNGFTYAAVALIAALLVFWMRRLPAEFPAMPGGGYVGQISGLFDTADKPVTIYVESIAKRSTILIVAFREGWEPQFATLVRANDGDQETLRFRPLTINVGDKIFTLDGENDGEKFAGSVRLGDDSVGTWWLKQTGTAELRKDQITLENQEEFSRWIALKAAHRARIQTLKELTAESAKELERTKAVSDLVAPESPALTAALSHRDALLREVEDLRQERNASTQRLQDLDGELDQMLRITRLGRTVDLARRVSTREDGWYLANWQQGGDVSGLEESLASEMNLDIAKLNKSYESVQELVSLKVRIAEEKARVAELYKRYQQKLDPQRKPEEGGEEKDDRDSPWWRGWGDVFG